MIYLVRHTKPDIEPGICYGASDIGVAGSFMQELHVVKSKLQGVTFNKVYSSPLQRCTTLARELPRSTDIVTDQRIKELDFGSWEMKPWNLIPPGDFAAWSNNYLENPTPGGESYTDLWNRVLDFWNELAPDHEGDVAIVCHAGPMRAVVSYLLQIPDKKTFNLMFSYGQIIKIQFIEAGNWLVTLL